MLSHVPTLKFRLDGGYIRTRPRSQVCSSTRLSTRMSCPERATMNHVHELVHLSRDELYIEDSSSAHMFSTREPWRIGHLHMFCRLKL